MLCTCAFCAPSPRNHQDRCSGANLACHQNHSIGVPQSTKRDDFISTMILELSSLKGTQIQTKARYVATEIIPGCVAVSFNTTSFSFLVAPVKLSNFTYSMIVYSRFPEIAD
jgi:hypothetical protein